MIRLRNLIPILFVTSLLVALLSLSGARRAKPSPGKGSEETHSSELAQVPLLPDKGRVMAPLVPAQEPARTNPITSLRAEQTHQLDRLSNTMRNPGAATRQSPFQREIALLAASKNWSNLITRIRGGELNPNMVLVPGTGNNLLRLAIGQGNTDVVGNLLAVGAKPGTREVIIAAGTGNLDLLQRLQAAGADMNVSDLETGLSPFVQAIRRGNSEMAEWLLQNGASMQPNTAGVTPLDECVASGGGSVETIQYLESKGFTLSKDHLSLVHPKNPRAQAIRDYIIARVGN